MIVERTKNKKKTLNLQFFCKEKHKVSFYCITLHNLILWALSGSRLMKKRTRNEIKINWDKLLEFFFKKRKEKIGEKKNFFVISFYFLLIYFTPHHAIQLNKVMLIIQSGSTRGKEKKMKKVIVNVAKRKELPNLMIHQINASYMLRHILTCMYMCINLTLPALKCSSDFQQCDKLVNLYVCLWWK